MHDAKYAEYVHECGRVAENISLNTATRFTSIPQVKGKLRPDGVYIDEGFKHVLEVKSVTTLTPTNYKNVRRKLKHACNQMNGFDYKVLHIHVLKITGQLLNLVNNLTADLVVIFTGGEPVKTVFLPRRKRAVKRSNKTNRRANRAKK